MNELILKKITLSVRINGMDFPFVADSKFAMRLSSLAKEAIRRAELCALTDCNDFSEASEFLSHAVDTLIGEGSSKKIFGAETPDPAELCEVLGLISDVFHCYRRSRIRELRGNYI